MHQLAHDKTDQENTDDFLQVNENLFPVNDERKKPTNPALYEGFTDAQIETWETNREKDLSGNGLLDGKK